MAQVDLGARQNRHQPLWDLAKMSSAVLRAMSLRVDMPSRRLPAAEASALSGVRPPETYLHAVATEDGLRLDEYLTQLLERPPLAWISAEKGTTTLLPNSR
jgi:glucosyl-3-phosphoglycerate synthase